MVIDEASPWNARWRMLLVLAMSCTMVLGWTGIAAAETQFTLTIPIDTSRGAPEGSVIKLAEEDVPDEAIGLSCTVTALAENQRSVHPNNDLIVSSGDSQLVLPDVEREGGVITEAEGVLVLGESVTVHLEMGEDEGFSGGLDVVIDCEPRTGRIIVVKEVTDGSDTGQSFDFTADYGDGEFSLGHGDQNDSGELVSGTYAVEEVVPDGWTLESATCDDESSPDAIDLSAGETITCTFVNDQPEAPAEPARIIVVKEVTEGSDTGQSFEFSADYGDGGFSLGHGDSNDSGELAPGTYRVEETVPDGWTLESAMCDDDSDPETIDLSAGETVTCTFVNDQVDDLVGAAIEVTVDGRCEVVGDDGVGFLDVTISVDDGATVVVTDSDGEEIDTLTSDGAIEVAEGATYRWEATPSEGFEFPQGADSSGSITIETCSDPETLPFTGPETDGLIVLAAVLLGVGVFLITSAPAREE